jgi:hypothetical protein
MPQGLQLALQTAPLPYLRQSLLQQLFPAVRNPYQRRKNQKNRMQEGLLAPYAAGNTNEQIKAAFARPGVLIRKNC